MFIKKFSLLRLTPATLATTFTFSLCGAAALAADIDNAYHLSHSEELREGYHWECTESPNCNEAHHTEDCYQVCDCIAHFFPTCYGVHTDDLDHGTMKDNAALSATFPAGEIISELNSSGDARTYLVTSNGHAFGFFTFSAGTVIEILVSPYEEIVTLEGPTIPAEPIVPAQPIIPEPPSTPANKPSSSKPEADVTIEEEDVPLAALPKLEDVADAAITEPVTETTEETVEAEIAEEAAPLVAAPVMEEEIILDTIVPMGNLPQIGTIQSPMVGVLAVLTLLSGCGLAAVSVRLMKRAR